MSKHAADESGSSGVANEEGWEYAGDDEKLGEVLLEVLGSSILT